MQQHPDHCGVTVAVGQQLHVSLQWLRLRIKTTKSNRARAIPNLPIE